jgi:hypothetical protein
LQDLDGIAAEDFSSSMPGAPSFTLRSRGAGARSAATTISLTGSATLAFVPSYVSALNDNLSDLQPRAHLYLAAGATNLSFGFPLDTTLLPDGFHELTAVAYEGSHVRTPTRITLPVRVRNSPLSATLNLLDLPAVAPVGGTYQIQVTVNTNDVSTVSLFTTGGLLDENAGQSAPVFTVNGAALGAGLHPFYALVETASGLRYRTQTSWVRLTP